MKTILIACAALLLTIQGFSTSLQPPRNIAFANVSHQSANDQNPKKLSKNATKQRQLYYKGRGTVGLIAGIVFGPIGFLGAHLFSHNKTVIDKAKIGFGIWFCAALIGLLVWDIIDTKPTIGDILGGIGQAILQGLADGI